MVREGLRDPCLNLVNGPEGPSITKPFTLNSRFHRPYAPPARNCPGRARCARSRPKGREKSENVAKCCDWEMRRIDRREYFQRVRCRSPSFASRNATQRHPQRRPKKATFARRIAQKTPRRTRALRDGMHAGRESEIMPVHPFRAWSRLYGLRPIRRARALSRQPGVSALPPCACPATRQIASTGPIGWAR